MRIAALGEFGLIERIKRRVKTDRSVFKGIGDDCAVIRFNADKYLLMTADMLVEGVDFLRKDEPFLVGRKAMAVSASDIAACGGLPRYALVSLGMPKRSSVGLADGLLEGMRDIARKFGINIVGGDISRAHRLTLDVSMTGVVEKRCLALRGGARKGDMLFVSGALGGSIRGKHLKFTPRIKEARFLVTHFKVNSMIDISDGLLQDLGHIMKESGAGVVLYEELIPVSKAARRREEALYMGEDFELLFSLSQKEGTRLQRTNGNFTFIGNIVEKAEGLRLIDARGKKREVKPAGFTHF